MAYKTLSKDSSGPKPKGNNLKIFKKFEKFYNNEFKELTDQILTDGNNLSQIVAYSCTDILTNIENNVRMHFFKYLKKFVNQSFKEQNDTILETLNGKEKIEKQKEFGKDLWQIKEDLINNTLNSPEKYHKWIKEVRPQILPREFIKSYEHDVAIYPQKYLQYMVHMNKLLESKELQQYQFFPLRTEIVPKYIPIDTKSVIELFVKDYKQEYLRDIENNKKFLWQSYFNMNHRIFRMKNYSFDHSISTDGFAVSIRFIHNSFIEKEKEKKLNMKIKREEAKILYEDLEDDEIQIIKDEKLATNKEIESNNKLEFDKKKDELKKLP